MKKQITVALALVLVAGNGVQADSVPHQVPAPKDIRINVSALVPLPVPPDFDKEVLVPLRAKQAIAAAEAARVAEEARLAQVAKDAADEAYRASQEVVYQPVMSSSSLSLGGTLLGSIGYASPFGNCVLEPGVNNPGWGNPSDWAVVSETPWVGATFLFWTNHTGIVTGIWSNGDIEVRHQNFGGGMHRFPASMFRGFR